MNGTCTDGLHEQYTFKLSFHRRAVSEEGKSASAKAVVRATKPSVQ